MFKTISVVGGDLRQITLAKLLEDDGYIVKVYGFVTDTNLPQLNYTSDLRYALDSDIIILPIPVSFDGININTPFDDKTLPIKEFIKELNPISPVFGGCISKELKGILDKKNIKYRDYMLRDELAIKNAIPTVEGAIEIAISETPFTIHNSKCLVLGYGKIGKALSKTLYALGAKTFVEARKYTDLALIEGHGYYPLTMKEAKARLDEFDIIFNTIPSLVLGGTELEKIRPDTLVIDLASKPGGAGFDLGKTYFRIKPFKTPFRHFYIEIHQDTIYRLL